MTVHFPEASGTLCYLTGAGPMQNSFAAWRREEGVADRVFFRGGVPFTKMTDFYAYAGYLRACVTQRDVRKRDRRSSLVDMPVVAFADGMGVSAQIRLPMGRTECCSRPVRVQSVRRMRTWHSDARSPGLWRDSSGSRANRAERPRARRGGIVLPVAVAQKIVDAFGHAQDHAAGLCASACAIEGPRAYRWYLTYKHFRPWTTVMTGIYLLGHLRPTSLNQHQRIRSPAVLGSWDGKRRVS